MIGGTALDEQRVAHDRGRVSDTADDDAPDRDPDVGGDGGSHVGECHQPDRHAVDRRHRPPLEPRGSKEGTDDRADPARRPHQAEPEVARVERLLRQHDLRDVDEGDREHRQVPGDEHGHQRPRAAHDRDPLGDVTPVPSRLDPSLLQHGAGDPEDQDGGAEEAGGVQPVGDVRARGGDEHPAEQRPDRDRQLVGGPQQRVRARELLGRDEVRQAGIGGGAGEARRDPGEERERDDLPRPDGEGEQDEGGKPEQVGAEEQPLAGEPVDEGAERKADRHRRQEVGDQERADPNTASASGPRRRRSARSPRSTCRARRRASSRRGSGSSPTRARPPAGGR